MQCEIRKSCNLRNVVYEIGKLTTPVGVILVDASGVESTEFFDGPRDKLWRELVTVFRDVKQAYEYTLEEDIRLHMNGPVVDGPIVLELDQAHAITKDRVRGLVKRLHDLSVKRVVVVCVTGGTNGVNYAEKLASTLEFANEDIPRVHGIDLMVVLNDDATEIF